MKKITLTIALCSLIGSASALAELKPARNVETQECGQVSTRAGKQVVCTATAQCSGRSYIVVTARTPRPNDAITAETFFIPATPIIDHFSDQTFKGVTVESEDGYSQEQFWTLSIIRQRAGSVATLKKNGAVFNGLENVKLTPAIHTRSVGDEPECPKE